MSNKKSIVVGFVPCPVCDAPASFNTQLGFCRKCGHHTRPLFEIYKAIIEKKPSYGFYYDSKPVLSTVKPILRNSNLNCPNIKKQKE